MNQRTASRRTTPQRGLFDPPGGKAPTSQAAARQIAGRARTIRQRVHEYFLSRADGATADEAEVDLAIRVCTITARINELVRDRKLHDSGERRKTRSGCEAIVWNALEGASPPTSAKASADPHAAAGEGRSTIAGRTDGRGEAVPAAAAAPVVAAEAGSATRHQVATIARPAEVKPCRCGCTQVAVVELPRDRCARYRVDCARCGRFLLFTNTPPRANR